MLGIREVRKIGGKLFGYWFIKAYSDGITIIFGRAIGVYPDATAHKLYRFFARIVRIRDRDL